MHGRNKTYSKLLRDNRFEHVDESCEAKQAIFTLTEFWWLLRLQRFGTFWFSLLVVLSSSQSLQQPISRIETNFISFQGQISFKQFRYPSIHKILTYSLSFPIKRFQFTFLCLTIDSKHVFKFSSYFCPRRKNILETFFVLI